MNFVRSRRRLSPALAHLGHVPTRRHRAARRAATTPGPVLHEGAAVQNGPHARSRAARGVSGSWTRPEHWGIFNPTGARRLELSSVLDPTLDTEVAPLGHAEIQKLYQDYKFGPHGLRLLRKQTFTSYTLNVATGDACTTHGSWHGQSSGLLLLEVADAERLANLEPSGGWKMRATGPFGDAVSGSGFVEHIQKGHPWTEQLALAYRVCARSCRRGLGPAKHFRLIGWCPESKAPVKCRRDPSSRSLRQSWLYIREAPLAHLAELAKLEALLAQARPLLAILEESWHDDCRTRATPASHRERSRVHLVLNTARGGKLHTSFTDMSVTHNALNFKFWRACCLWPFASGEPNSSESQQTTKVANVNIAARM